MSNEQHRATRGTKTRLDRDTIVAAALELAAQPGVLSFSFRELGAHLGVDPTAVYRHFRNKEDLMRALLEEVTSRAFVFVTAPDDDWREQLRQHAMSAYRELSRYPAVGVEAIVLTTNGPAEHRAIESMLSAFARAGLRGDELVRHYALLASHVLSSSANLARARAERPDAEIESMTWLDGPLLVDPREFPLIAEHSTRLVEMRDAAMFRAGVEMVIESAERTASATGDSA